MADNDMSFRQRAVIELLVKEEIPAAEIHMLVILHIMIGSVRYETHKTPMSCFGSVSYVLAGRVEETQ